MMEGKGSSLSGGVTFANRRGSPSLRGGILKETREGKAKLAKGVWKKTEAISCLKEVRGGGASFCKGVSVPDRPRVAGEKFKGGSLLVQKGDLTDLSLYHSGRNPIREETFWEKKSPLRR